ncbi:MAG: glycosyl transferase [Nitrospinaceae bacterium]|nr:MAG: glycosyl transferase [Nitrospinaceae bacterium]
MFDQLTLLDGCAILIFWAIVWHRWSRQCSGAMPELPEEKPNLPVHPPLVSVIVPARNEAQSIEKCVRSLLSQDYPRLEVIAVDDCSEDATGEILSALAKTDSRLQVIQGKPLPEGWMGKAHALSQGYRQARGDWLLFTDADTHHEPGLLSKVMGQVLSCNASLATVAGEQENPGFGVALINLAVFSYIFMVSDRKGFANPRSRQSLVNGQYVLIAREAYEVVGTHEALREYSSTDVSLGYLAKLKGFLTLGINAGEDFHTTMYSSMRQAFAGWSRSLVNGIWTALGKRLGTLTLILLTVGFLFFWVVPWLTWLDGMEKNNSSQALTGFLQLLAVFCTLWMKSGRFLKAVGDWLLIPFSYLFFIAMVATGLTGALFRGGTVWKGRVVPTARRLPPWKPEAPKPRTPDR